MGSRVLKQLFVMAFLILQPLSAEAGRSAFLDVSRQHWASSAVERLLEVGIPILPCFGSPKYYGDKPVSENDLYFFIRNYFSHSGLSRRSGSANIGRRYLKRLLSELSHTRNPDEMAFDVAQAHRQVSQDMRSSDGILVAVSQHDLAILELADSLRVAESGLSELHAYSFRDVPNGHYAERAASLTFRLGLWDDVLD